MWKLCFYGIFPVTSLLLYMFKSTIRICIKGIMGLPGQNEFCQGFLTETYRGCIVQSNAAGTDLPNERLPCVKMTIVFGMR
jgi:hypothetical protein